MSSIKLGLSFLLLTWQTILVGQLNFKVGYKNGFISAPALTHLMESYNTRFIQSFPTGRIDAALKPFEMLNGLELGMRYRLGSFGAEVSYSSMGARKDVFFTKPDGASFTDRRFLSMSEISIGLENYLGIIGYGASFDLRSLKSSTPIPGSKRKKRSTGDESGRAGKFYLIFQFPGQNVGIAFKPYIQFPLSKYDLASFDQDLNTKLYPEYIAPKPQEERFLVYGITIALYNGKQ